MEARAQAGWQVKSTTHIGLNGQALCGESHLLVEKVVTDASKADCESCLWVSAAQLFGALNVTLQRQMELFKLRGKVVGRG